MKRFFALSLLITSTLVWSVSSVKVQNFNFNYSDGNGVGTASAFEIITSSAQVYVNRVGTDLEFSSPLLEGPVHWRNAPALILNSKVVVKGFNLALNNDLVANLSSGQFDSDSKMTVQNFSAQCSRSNGEDVFEQVVMGCLHKGLIKVSSFESRSVDAFVSLLSDDVGTEGTHVRSLNLSIDKKSFSLSANAKFGVNGTLRGKGTIDVDYLNKKAVIRVNEVKFGFLNITGKFFSEIEKLDVEGMEVRKPYIYFNLKDKE